ncbi:small heat shock protein [Agrilactobacillus composti DSM 18527 = JCM 14202]|nr:Hsp20/alpha crystallin family protein [Agrilactobacillus composti]GAF38887.1 small heat shock protein [Agrilactobacillus composti DSM 18527 = JCM 14202]
MANEVTRRNNVDWGMDPFFDNLEDHFFGSMAPEVQKNLKTDIQDTDKAYIAVVDLPGVNKQDIQMNYEDGVLNINVNKSNFVDHEDKQGNLLLSERSYGTMSRSFRLPNVDQAHISAEYNNGVLKITLPKTTEVQGNGNIEIQ